MDHVISNGRIEAEISETGAELVRLIVHGRERLWQNETGSWSGHAPILFPVCGRCAVTKVPMPRHGFARGARFRLVSLEEDAARFSLTADAHTMALYPYAFRLEVRYRLRGEAIETELTIGNEGETPMPFSCGFHPSFALAAPPESYRLRFEKTERFSALEHDEEGFLTGKTSDMGMGNELKLRECDFENGRTVILGKILSRSVELIGPRGKSAALSFDAKNLLLWRPGGGNAVCIEPWHNLPDRAEGAPPFANKAGVRVLAPHERAVSSLTVTYFSEEI